MASLTLRSVKGATLTNNELDANFTALNTELAGKQAALVSGTSIKTVNGMSVLGSGNIQIDGGVTSFNSRTGAVTLSSGDVTGALGFTPVNKAGDTMTGNLAFSGTGLRITGDFSNATRASRLLFQTSTANSNTFLSLIPNGTGGGSGLDVHLSGTDPDNTAFGRFAVTSASVNVRSGVSGTGTQLPMDFYIGSSIMGRLSTAGNWLFGTTADNATDKIQVVGSVSATSFSGSGANLTGLTSGQITTALGFTPYNATNPSGYITNTGNARVGVENNGTLVGTRRNINFIPGTGISLSISDDAANEEVDVTITSTATGGVTSFNTRTGAVTLSSGDVTTALGYTPLSTGGGTLTGSNSSSSPILAINVSGSGAFQRGVRMLNSGMAAGDSLMYAVGQADNARNMGQFYFYYAGSGSTSNRLSAGLHSVDDVFNIFGSGNVMIGTTSDSGHKFNVSGTMNSTGALTQAGNQVLHAGNFSSYAQPLLGYTAAYGNAGFQSKSLDTVSTPGLYQYDGAFGGTKPPDGAPNYRTIEIGSDGRFSQIALPWSSENMYFRRQTGASWSGWRTVIHDGNYNSYAPTLSGGGASGTWGINVTGNAGSLTATTATGIQTNYVAGINTITPGQTTYGIAFSGSSSTDNAQGITWGWSGTAAQAGIYVQSSGAYGTKMYLATTDSFATGAKTAVSIDHVGAVNIIRGALTQAGNQVLHAGNYSSYALPLSGGTLSGAIRAPQITAGGSTNTDANLGVQGTSHLTGTIYYGGSVGNVNSWSSISTSSAGTHTFSGSRFIFDRYGYGSQALLDLQNGAITLSQQTSITGNLGVLRSRLTFSSTAGDANHSIYNNYNNNDGEGGWDGMKMNVYAGLRVRVGNASGAVPTQIFSLDSSGVRLGNGTSSPAGTAFSHTLAGVGTNRVVNFDGNGNGAPSVWWTSGSRAYGAIDAQDPGLTFWANNGSSWQKQITLNYGSVNIDTALTIGGYTAIHTNNPQSTTEWYHSDRDFPSGTLITTNINYAVSSGDPFVLEIRGNSYGNIIPLDLQYQGYIYYDTIINHGGLSNGLNISGLVALNVGGNLCFWFPSQGYWNGYNVKVYAAYATRATNRVTSITGTAKPSGTKEVALTANIRQSLNSGNFSNYALPISGGTVTGTLNTNGRFSANNGMQFFGSFILGGSGATYDNSTGARMSENYGALWNFSNSATWHHQIINGSSLVGFQANGGNFGNGNILSSGNITAYYSDERLKTKVTTITNALDKVRSLEGFIYVENELAKSLGYANSGEQAGVSAQRVKAVLPQAVSLAPVDMQGVPETGEVVSKSGENYLTVDYSRLSPLLIEAIKEQDQEVIDLRNRVAQLESLINKLIGD